MAFLNVFFLIVTRRNHADEFHGTAAAQD